MRGLFVAFAALIACPAIADDFTSQLERNHQSRAFWLHNQAWPITQPDSTSNRRPHQFTLTYMDGIASRIEIGPGGRVDLFQDRLGGSGTALVGYVQSGAAMLSLRWRPGE